MTNEEVKNFISNNNPAVAVDETGEFLNLEVSIAEFRQLAKDLFNHGFHYLFCLTCVDWKTNLTMVYHLTSTHDRNRTLVVKVKLDPVSPAIDTVSDIWKTAEFHEREVYDLFGVQFTNHPDLRRILLTDDWSGWPLRKDYSDPVNMIKL